VADSTGFAGSNGILIAAGTSNEEHVEVNSTSYMDPLDTSTNNTIVLQLPLINSHAPFTLVRWLQHQWVYAGGDPLVRYGDKKVKFFVPNNQPLALLQTPHVHVVGATFAGHAPHLQWFGTFWVTVPDGREMFKVSIRRDMHRNNTQCPSGNCAALDVKVFGKPVSFDKMPERGRDFGLKGWPAVQFRIGRMAHVPPRVLETTFEYVYVTTPDLVFMISPAHAAVDFPSRPWLALKYSHLDLFINEMKRPDRFGGIFPQLFGVVPMTPEVEAMTLYPEASDNMSFCPRMLERRLLREEEQQLAERSRIRKSARTSRKSLA
jgi:hypothetical protein